MMMTTTITEHNEHRCDHRDGIDIGNRNASIHPSRHIKNNITTMATTSRKKNRASPNEKRTRSREASESEPSPKRVKRLAKTMAVAQPPTTKAQEENITNSLGLVVATTIGRPPLPVRQKHQSVAMTNESSEPVCISPVTTNTSTETSTPSRRVSFSNSQVHLIPSRVCDEYRREQQHVFHHHLFSNASKKTPPSFHLSFLLNWVCVCSVLWMGVSAFLHPNKIVAKPNSTLDPVLVADHILPPRHSSQRSNITLREFLVDPAGIDLAMAVSTIFA